MNRYKCAYIYIYIYIYIYVCIYITLVAFPIVSQAANTRIRLLSAIIFCVLKASDSVTAKGSPRIYIYIYTYTYIRDSNDNDDNTHIYIYIYVSIYNHLLAQRPQQ